MRKSRQPKKKLPSLKIGKVRYTIYHLCYPELIGDMWYMINRVTGTKMTWENGEKAIKKAPKVKTRRGWSDSDHLESLNEANSIKEGMR